MFRKMCRFICAMLKLIINFFFTFNEEKLLDCIPSKINQFVLITSCGSKRRMRFTNISSGCQSEIDLKHLNYPSEEYIQLMIISLIYFPIDQEEKEILIFGLGGGILPRSISLLQLNSRLTIIEIDPIVYQMAQKYFYFQNNSNINVIIQDAKDFMGNLSLEKTYHLIYMDIYDNTSSVPLNVRNEEFFRQIKSHLNPINGLLVLNLVCIYRSFNLIKKILFQLFENSHFLTFRTNNYLNIIIFISILPFNENHLNNLLIEQMKNILSIDFRYLLNRKQQTNFKQNQFNEQDEQDDQNISFLQFYNAL